jgi:hypothetical protein
MLTENMDVTEPRQEVEDLYNFNLIVEVDEAESTEI